MSDIEGIEQINKALSEIPDGMARKAARIILSASREMQTYLRVERLTGGTTETRLRRRTGDLAASVMVKPPEIKDTTVEGGVTIGTKYARSHFGPRGEKFTIRSKGKWLTIPIDQEHGGAALTKAGVGRGSAMFGPWTNTFVRKSKKGNLIIWGQQKSYSPVRVGGVAVKGVSIRKVSSKIVPLFVLKQQVSIPYRIDPKEVLDWIAPKIREKLIKAGIVGFVE